MPANRSERIRYLRGYGWVHFTQPVPTRPSPVLNLPAALGKRPTRPSDHIRTVRMVTSDGLIRTVDADHEPDLFWAVRGAGKGRYGVVTEIDVGLVPVSR